MVKIKDIIGKPQFKSSANAAARPRPSTLLNSQNNEILLRYGLQTRGKSASKGNGDVFSPLEQESLASNFDVDNLDNYIMVPEKDLASYFTIRHQLNFKPREFLPVIAQKKEEL